jgi:hypothetical protein
LTFILTSLLISVLFEPLKSQGLLTAPDMRSKLFFDELAAERYDAMIDQQGPAYFSHLSRHAKAACSLSSLTCLQGTPRLFS